MRPTLLLGCAVLIASPIAIADEQHQHAAHEHGAAQLSIAQEDEELEIQFNSPAFNIFGFEHEPQSEQQHEIVEQAIAQLVLGDRLFSFGNKTKCVLEGSSIESSMIEHLDHNDHEHGDDHKHDHDEKHDDHKHDDHTHDDAKDHEHESMHSDVAASWHFHCKNTHPVIQVEVKLFDFFSNLEEIDVQYLTDRTQGAVELTPKKTVIRF